ncbi:MAG: hypothetical protein ACYSO1_04695, partial [Planctomycetota bacterium]
MGLKVGLLSNTFVHGATLERHLKELSQPVGSYRFYRLSHAWGIRWHLFRSWITGDDFNSLE